MKNLLLLTAIIIFSCKIMPQYRINITVTAPGIGKAETIYITGSSNSLGNWNPSSVKLDRINDTTWAKTFLFNRGENIEFKFTKGSWNTEALTGSGEVPQNYSLTIIGDTSIRYVIKKWKDSTFAASQNKFNEQITGSVKYIHQMKGSGIKPRDIIVWLPPSYKTDTSKRYPVLYMHDGQNLFDPKTSTFGVDWQLDEAADSLIKSGIINEIIIVGIYNTPDRSEEYGNTDLGRNYMDFVVNKLKPYIDKNFRTLPGRENTATGGSSMGGLISFMLAWEHPDVFSKAACLSPAFHIDDINYIKNVANYSGVKKSLQFYIDIGTIGLESRLKPGVDEMFNLLEKKDYKSSKDVVYFIAEGAGHSETAWAGRNWRYLEYFFKK